MRRFWHRLTGLETALLVFSAAAACPALKAARIHHSRSAPVMTAVKRAAVAPIHSIKPRKSRRASNHPITHRRAPQGPAAVSGRPSRTPLEERSLGSHPSPTKLPAHAPPPFHPPD